jgi:hypothetical protein
VTSTDAQLELRPPRWARVWVVVFQVVFVSTIASGVVPLRGDPGRAASLLICVFAAALGWRLFRLAAIGTPDGRLVVRNHWRDRTVQRDDVAEVSVASMHRGSLGQCVQLTLRDGSTLRLDVTEVPFRIRRLDRHATAVREWVSGRPRPFG